MLYKLIKNEMYKMLKKKKMFVFMSIITVMAFIPVIINKFQDMGIDFKVNTLPLENLSWSTELVIPIFIAILVGDLITNEYNNGTMKLPLINGISRKKLIISKIITLVILISILVGFTLIISYISGAIFLEWGVPFNFNNVVLNEFTGVMYTVGLYLLSIIPLTAFGLLVIFISLKVKSSGTLVGITIGIFFIMNLIRQLSSTIRPLIISNFFNTSYLLNLDVFSKNILILLVISLLYSLIFFLLSMNNLLKKDIVK